MTLRLILTRHAKSTWDDPHVGDHGRPLNERGRVSADAIGDWLAARGFHPDQALVSSAARTRETWDRIAARLANPPAATIRNDLYLAEPERMLAVLRAAKGKAVMMIAHNPGSAWFARALAAHPPSDSRFAQYPTAATTVFDFDIDTWSDVTWSAGEVVDFVVPRDLTENR